MGKTSSVICRVIKIGKIGKGQYILIDCKDKVLCKIDATKEKVYEFNPEIKWDNEKETRDLVRDDKNWKETTKKISSFLGDKTRRYAKKRKDSREDDKYRVWKLGIKQESQAEYQYINIASCKAKSEEENKKEGNKRFCNEINDHINQLLYIINDKTKATTYQKLWERANEVVFEEIFVDEYIKTINETNSYLKSLIAPEENPKTVKEPMKSILSKLRAQYVEGRLAGEEKMASKEQAEKSGVKYDGGIWNAGSTGIDGEVYMYYKKQKGDTHE